MTTLALPDPYARLMPTELVETPFRYFVAEHCLKPEMEAALLDWFESTAPWNLVETDFYEQFEFDMRDADVPQELAPLVAPDMLHQLRYKMEQALGARLGPDVQLVVHRLDPGQRIAIHNDMREGGETHRLTVQLNRGLSDEDGGFFMLFNSDDASDIHRILRPISGSAIGFAISSASHHAVSRIHGGVRFTLVYSFYAVADS
ncbi:cyclophane-containing peptide 2OG-Fe(II) oxygenase YhhC [Mesorhizobium sp. M0578]|uniref:cyclophane-containing peptide 2OG-Fe(II) oxygenase YhhC n=1 Tax=unclassified Mesorhizobium TaxID=325217 RepID=UPI00333B56A2